MLTFNIWLPVTVVLLYTSEIVSGEDQIQLLLEKASTIAINKILENYGLDADKSGQSTEYLKLSDVLNGGSSNIFGLIQSKVEAKNGHLTYVCTPQIQADVRVTRNAALGILINVPLSFKGIKAIYEEFTLDLPLVGEKHGEMEAAIDESVFNVSILVSPEPHCKTELNDVTVQEFGRLEPTVTGMGYRIMDSVAASIIKNFLKDVQEESQTTIMNTLKQRLNEAIKSTDVCSIFVGGYLLNP